MTDSTAAAAPVVRPAAVRRRRLQPDVGQKPVPIAESTADLEVTPPPINEPPQPFDSNRTPDKSAVGHIPPAAGERVAVDAGWFDWVQQEVAHDLIREATRLEIGFDDASGDVFDADLLLAASEPSGREIGVWLRLTPTVILDLQSRLTELLIAQRCALELPAVTSTADIDEDIAQHQERGRIQRLADPLQIRRLREGGSTKSVYLLAGAIVALVLLATLIRIFTA